VDVYAKPLETWVVPQTSFTPLIAEDVQQEADLATEVLRFS
jgi:hypothetical protein